MQSAPQTRLVEVIRTAWAYLNPGAAERDEGFLLEIQRVSRRGLYILPLIYTALILLFYPLMAMFPTVGLTMSEVADNTMGAVVLIGGMILFARSRWGLEHARTFAFGVVLLSTAGGYEMDFRVAQDVYQVERYVLADVSAALLVAVVVIPALPWQMLLAGLVMAAAYPIIYPFTQWAELNPEHSTFTLTMIMILDALLCAMLSAVNYHRLHTAYLSNQHNMSAQRKLLLSETAVSMGRLSAALSHELNSPLGTLKSSVDTMRELRARHPSASPEQRERLDKLADQLDGTASDALERIEEIVRRMNRFTNLDRADERDCSPDEIVRDVVALLEPEERDRVRLQLDPGQGRTIYSRPQQIAAVVSSLVQYALATSPRDVPVAVSTERNGATARIIIEDRRPPIPHRQLNSLFDPNFKVHQGRVAAGNWTWFNARQILRELGGDLTVHSSEESTKATLELPVLTGT